MHRALGSMGLAVVAALASCASPQDGTTAPPAATGDKGTSLAALDAPDRQSHALPDRVVASLPLEPGMTVADIGAGSGYFSRRLAKRVPDGKVIAVDVDIEFKQHIEAQREGWGTPNIEPRLALDDNPVLATHSVDLIFMSNTYPYLKAREDYFRQVKNALRSPGYVAIVDYRLDADCQGASTCPPKDARIAKSQVISELGAAGYELANEEDFLPHQYFLLFRIKA